MSASSKDYIYQVQQERFEIFKSQDPENGHFDITFEIGGKKLLANRFILTPCSDTLKAMISDRWSNKDEAVKIEAYSYDNFYQFLCFLYSGSCSLTAENVFQLTDMAEFYAVPFLKEPCEKFLLDMEYYVESIEEMLEFSQKYSMKHMEDLVEKFVSSNYKKIITSEGLLSYKKPFMDVLASITGWRDETFEAVYKWTEHQVTTQKDDEDESFNFLETVKTQFREKFPQIFSINKALMLYGFLRDFVVEKGIFLSLGEFRVIYYNRRDEEDRRFKLVYDLAEKQALQKQKMVTDAASFNIFDCIKADLIEVVEIAKFYEIEKKFLMESLVPAGILTKEQASHVHDTRVTIENNGKAITGIFNDEIGVRCTIQDKSCNVKRKNTTIARFLKFRFPIPSSPSTITKMKGVDWYLCLDTGGVLTLKHHSVIDRSDYILAEMKSQSEFCLAPDVKTNLTVSFNNDEPIL